jgi:hypothetical protein
LLNSFHKKGDIVKKTTLRLGIAFLSLATLGMIIARPPLAQMQQSGGSGGGAVTQSGTWTVQPGNTPNSTPWLVTPNDGAGHSMPTGDASARTIHVTADNASLPVTESGSWTEGLIGGVANVGIVRAVPSSCTQSTNFASATAQVGTGAGTTVTSTTTCVTFAYANNITNSAVTLRLADKSGTPIIWFGGNADFTIPANSNMRIPIDGVTFTSGITAIAGAGSAVNLQINGLQ